MRFQITEAVKNLLIINVLLFIGTLAFGGGELFYKLFSLYFPKNERFNFWQLLTHMFMHGNAIHLLSNMFVLWMFGTAVEQRLGAKKFLFVYFSAGLGALAFQLGFHYFEFINGYEKLIEAGVSDSTIINTLNEGMIKKDWRFILGNDLNSFAESFVIPMVGASGCLMGILVAFGMMNPNAELMMIFLPIPIKAKYFIPGIIGLDIISALTGQSFLSPSNTAYMAHIGGAFIGFIVMWYWKKNNMDQYRFY